MRNIIFKLSTLIFTLAVLLVTSCKKLDINVDPNNPPIEKATPEVLFPSATMSTAGMIGGQLAVAGGIWSQYFTQSNNSSQFRDIDAYNLTSTSEVVNLPYDQLFAGALYDYVVIQTQSKASANWKYNLMATVMKAYTYEVLVDLYDKVPYTEAFKGQIILQPKFDDGASIYSALLVELNDALAKDYISGELSPSQKKTDFVFGGDMDLWTSFANTLKLKMYLRMVNANPTLAKSGIEALYASNAKFLDIDAGVVNTFVDVPNNSNPMYEFNIRRLNTTTNIRASVTLTSFLVAKNDPRAVSYFGSATPSAIHQGDYTATQAEQPTYANASVFVQKATDPVYFISKAESYFMQAEARERYFSGADAENLYNLGVKSAFAQFKLDATPLLSTVYAYPTAGNFETKLEAIIVQKWLSLPGSHALEAFFEQNRTGYPKISPVYSTNPLYTAGDWVYSKNGFTGAGKFPKRFPFPSDERSRNTNTPPEVSISKKVLWAK
jgi:hypothetical protein